jgi:PleD family two-component response regulator
MAKQVFSTGEAAQICGISQQTIIRCFDRGELKGFLVPGSKFRRIPRDNLIRFMKHNNISLGQLDSAKRKVLIVEDDQQIVRLLVDVLNGDGRFETKSTGSGYEAGLLTEKFRPDVLVLDYLLPDINGNLVCQTVRANPDLADTKIIIVSGVIDRNDVDSLLADGANEFIQKPFDVNHLIDRICSLLSM